MRFLIHDYSGHPFQAQLSRELARLGHTVLHNHFVGFQTPKGALVKRSDDPATFTVEGLDLGEPFAKNSFVKRYFQECRYGSMALVAARRFQPDVFVSSNMPLDPLKILQRGLARDGCRVILWWQDIYSVAMGKILPNKLPVIGNVVAERYRRLERRICRDVDSIVCITDDFLSVLSEWSVDSKKATVIENWAPLDEIRPLNQDNAWAREQGMSNRPILLYSGTLGLKHNPELLWRAATRIGAADDLEGALVVVISEGIGADLLKQRKANEPAVPLTVLPFQPYDRLSEVLASATAVAAILEPEAGVFSVPSKVLSYLAAGRAIVLAAPPENLASRTVSRIGAGKVVAPDDLESFAEAALALLRDPELAIRAGANGRSHAARNFDVSAIAQKFEELAAVRLTSDKPAL